MKPRNVLTILACLLVTAHSALADRWPQIQKIIASDGAATDYFGYSVAVSGKYAIVGAFYNDDMGTNSGSAYIFCWNGTTWTQQAKLLPSDGAVGDLFGYSVAISGDVAIVGAKNNDTTAANSGSAYIFKRNDTAWTQQCKLIASDGAAEDNFGCCVSISSDMAIVGAYLDDDMGTNSGSVYIFNYDGTAWNQQQKMTAPDGAAYDYFGYSVSVNGNHAIVGAYQDNDKGVVSGSAYIFNYDGTTWNQQQKLVAADGAVLDFFGYSVAISNDYAIIGAYGDDDKASEAGSAYLFKYDGTTWNQQQKLTASDGTAQDVFGMAVTISDDWAMVGASYDDKGSVYLFKNEGTTWTQQVKLIASDGTSGDYFGISVAINNGFAIAGAYYDSNPADRFGSAYLYEFCPNADLNSDCKVNLLDFAEIAKWWLYEPGN